jgi:hypothetical protein
LRGCSAAGAAIADLNRLARIGLHLGTRQRRLEGRGRQRVLFTLEGLGAAGEGERGEGGEGTNPFWRQASNTVTATAFDRLRLRCPARIGSRNCCGGGKASQHRGRQAADSEPNTSQSPGANATSCTARVPRVVRANRRSGIGPLGFQQGRPARVPAHLGVLVVVEAGAAHVLVVHREAERLDQVQRAAGVGRQPDDVAGVGRDLGRDQDDAEHQASSVRGQHVGPR